MRLGRLEKRLRELGATSVAVVSVMGAFRTGKSFLLDLFLRFLRWEADHPQEAQEAAGAEQVPRGSEDYALPTWITSAGAALEGATDDSEGFRFKGGMDACTEGIWIWPLGPTRLRSRLLYVEFEVLFKSLREVKLSFDSTEVRALHATD